MILSAKKVKRIKAVKESIKARKEARIDRKTFLRAVKGLKEKYMDYDIISADALDFAGSQSVVNKLRRKGYTVEPIKHLADYGIVISYLSYDELPEDIKHDVECCKNQVRGAAQ